MLRGKVFDWANRVAILARLPLAVATNEVPLRPSPFVKKTEP
jgi:hypothetical protein